MEGKTKIRLTDNTVEGHSTNKNHTIEILNDDCLIHIFEYLPVCDRIRLERVSKRWCAVSRMSWNSFKILRFNENLWGNLNEATITKNVFGKVFKLCGKFLQVLILSADKSVERSLFVKIETNINQINMSPLLKLCPNLTSLDFGSINVGLLEIKSLSKNCRNLVELSIGTMTKNASNLLVSNDILATFTNLRVLDLTCYFGFPIEFIHNKSIQELRIDLLNLTEDTDLLTAAIRQLQNLHTLIVRRSYLIGPCEMDWNIIKKSNIKKFDISYGRLADSELRKMGSALEHLTSLNVSYVKRGEKLVTDVGLRAVVSPNLEYLNIDGMNVEGSSLLNLPHLRELSCKNCRNLKIEYFQSLLDTSDKLESIDLQGVNNVGGFITSAIESIKSRRNNAILRMFVDKVDQDLTDVPENFKLFEYQSNRWYEIKSTSVVGPTSKKN